MEFCFWLLTTTLVVRSNFKGKILIVTGKYDKWERCVDIRQGFLKKYLWSPIDYLIQSIYLLCWLLLTKSMTLNVTSMKYRKLNTGGYLDADQENKPWRCQHQRMWRSSEFSTWSRSTSFSTCHSVLCAALCVINSFINNDH